ncbi:MAG: BlaI/MecI/CopY family transcriptional regulator [Verrucomicrobiales bacterium]|jgi:BlaI family penicillinase repressor|nr:BlaI/MecI/CopY family transcriptional regulator [Verrucomicrobiales bacterium]
MSKNHAPNISDSEWTVMRVFWSRGESTSSEVIAALASETDWKPKTIQTLIRRLVQKEALTYQKIGREYLYRPAVDERTCEEAASRRFLDRVFDGKLAPFLATFVESSNYSEEEIAQLKQILEEGGPDGNSA